MKKILLITIFFLLGVLTTTALSANEVIVHGMWGGVRVYTAPPVYVTPQIVVPYTTPIPPTPLYQPPVKPNFQTPVRDGLWYGMYYSRMWRYNRLGRILNYPHAQIPQQND
jgi:hypothetical protein